MVKQFQDEVMTTPTLFKEYIWLVNTIHQAKRITFDEINQKWLKTEMRKSFSYRR